MEVYGEVKIELIYSLSVIGLRVYGEVSSNRMVFDVLQEDRILNFIG